ncbi:MAG: BTAD domain-containing putative transcriptional regulator, partial [Pseudonocardia sediminis]
MASLVETECPAPASPGHAIRLLGPLEVRGSGGVVEVGGVRRQAVLALLVLHEGRPVSLERLIVRLWPFRPPANAAASVRNNISALRKLLVTVDGVCIETVGSSYVLRLPPGALDARTARARIRRGLRLLDGDQARAAGVELRAALSLWRGGLLPNLRQAGYDWAELTELDELWLLASESLAEADLRCGRHRDLVPRLKCLVRQHPERQVLHRQRVTALAGAGRPGEAVAAYHEARAALRAAGQTVGVQLSAVHRALLDRTDATTPRLRV